jgi:predicted molibdopterin-dependent oxidoreductase YjgC
MSFGLTKLGDYDSHLNGMILTINDNNYQIYTEGFGILIENEPGTTNQTVIGDFTGNLNNTYFIVNDLTQKIEYSANLKTSSAGGSSGDYLKVNVGGTDYVIELLNP